MKNLTTIFSVLLVLTLFSSCKKDNSYNNQFSDIPEANAKFDNIPDSGLFRGVMIGSSGTIIIDGNNFGKGITATATIDGERFFFDRVATPIGQDGVFLKASNGSTLHIALNNQDVYEVVEANIIGHPNAKFIIEKETSQARVRCYEGTYSGGDNGVINGLVYKEFDSNTVSLEAIFRSNADPTFIHSAGGNANTDDIVVAGNASTGSTFSGKVFGSNQNEINGTWTNSRFNINGKFNCKRTL
jgi:hypothetical protein